MSDPANRGGALQEIYRKRSERGRTQTRDVSREEAVNKAREGARRDAPSKDRSKY